MKNIRLTPGRFRVMRFCCLSGNCFECHGLHILTRRKRLLQIDRVSRQSAQIVARNWRDYGAVVEPMPRGEEK